MENDKRNVMDWLNDMAHDEKWPCYYSDSELQMLAKDALELLKKQETKPPEWHIGRAHCPECGELFPKKKEREINYCFQCGQAVKRE